MTYKPDKSFIKPTDTDYYDIADQNANMDKVSANLDAIKDEFGYVNEEIGISHSRMMANKDAIRAAVHSGVLDYVDVIGDSYLEAPLRGQLNIARPSSGSGKNVFLGETGVIINGEFVNIPSIVLTMPDPPAADYVSAAGRKGEREDLIFLEGWYEKSLNSNDIAFKTRLRVVEDVDFVKYNADGFCQDSSFRSGEVSHNYKTAPQGANDEPITPISHSQCFMNHTQLDGWKNAGSDKGLYRAGEGNQASKDLLKTYDGYVYAIPLFRVKRRNNGGFSAMNGNGARDYLNFTPKVATAPIVKDDPFEVELNNGSKLKVGDRIYYFTNGVVSQSYYFEVTAKGIGDFVTVMYSNESSSWKTTEVFIWYSDRPDRLYANIISERDIIDLRHKVSLTGFNYQQLLEENFDKLLRGELQTKEPKKMKKTYFGVPKTPIDEHTVFYASLDGTTVKDLNKVGLTFGQMGTVFAPSPTGLGAVITSSQGLTLIIPKTELDGAFTLDFLISKIKEESGVTLPYYLTVGEESIYDYRFGSLVATEELAYLQTKDIFHYVRYIKRADASTQAYIDGKEVSLDGAWTHDQATGDIHIRIGSNMNNHPIYQLGDFVISDIMISNVDRGDVFKSLPKDFIEGYAELVPAMSKQRRTYADPLMSQPTISFARIMEGITTEGIILYEADGVTPKTTGNWANGEKIKVKGMGQEIVTGIADADTALTIVTQYTVGDNCCYVDDLTGLAVGDVFDIMISSGAIGWQNKTIVAIDTDTKKISFAEALATGSIYALVETTASSSVPTVYYMNGTTKTIVNGAWTGLGSTTATFTLGTNVDLTNQVIEIAYGLAMRAGQGKIPVYEDVLAGEVRGISATKETVQSDFKGKVARSNIENPHRLVYSWREELMKPAQIIAVTGTLYQEPTQGDIDNIMTLNGVLGSTGTTTLNQIPHQVVSFDIVHIVEDKYGIIPAEDKVQWLKDNVERLDFSHVGYGECPSGNKLCITSWTGEDWFVTPSVHNEATPLTMGGGIVSTLKGGLGSDGIIHCMIYTDPSDGVIESRVYTDYVEMHVTLKPPKAEMMEESDLAVIDDFKGKVSASVIENPHKASYNIWSSLLAPDGTHYEFTDQQYGDIVEVGGTVHATTTPTSGDIPQTMFSFDLIRLIEDKYGEIPSIDKVQWLKDNITDGGVLFYWHGYGTCPSGNKALVTMWRPHLGNWDTSETNLENYGDITRNGYVSKIGVWNLNYSYLNNLIDSNGFLHYLAYTDPSDGVTPSTLYTDYVSLEVTLKGKTGYTMLTPENKRRDSVRQKQEQEGNARGDFKGKVSTSVDENPNITKTANASSLLAPSSGALAELGTPNINQIAQLDDSIYSTATSVNGNISQQLFSFDVVRMIEDKYGEIPSHDKIQWLKDSVHKMYFGHYGYGESPSGNYLELNLYNFASSVWTAYSGETRRHTNDYATKVIQDVGESFANVLTNDGFAHAIVFTNASDGVVTSSVYTDYVECKVYLSYQAMKEIMTANGTYKYDAIAFVQPDTRSVETMFPVEECYGLALYGDHVPYQLEEYANDGKVVQFADSIVVTTYGTGKYRGLSFRPYIPRIVEDSEQWNKALSNLWGYYVCSDAVAGIRVPILHGGGGYRPNPLTKDLTNLDIFSERDALDERMTNPNSYRLAMGFAIIVKDNALFLLVTYRHFKSIYSYVSIMDKTTLVPLQGRPLIKEV